MDKSKFDEILNDNLDLLKDWMQYNLLASGEAREVTLQSNNAFAQAVGSKRVTPFFKAGGSGLYLRSELEHYRDNKRVPRNKKD